MARGTFIVLEGGEGSGKTTIMQRLRDALPADTVYARVPGGTVISERIRDVVLSNKHEEMDPRTELLLFAAARAQVVAEVIKPALEKGNTVVCDRYTLSTIVYQVDGLERPEDLLLLRTIAETTNQGCEPDLIILLDTSPAIGLARKQRDELNRYEAKDVAFHERIRAAYRARIADYPHTIIDADRPLEAVWPDVLKAVQSKLSPRV